jgi:hypothetical protein
VLIIRILLRVIDPVQEPTPPFEPGMRFLFSNDLRLERYDDSTPGYGLPQADQQRLAGTHSGSVTILRVAGANDRFFPLGSLLVDYHGTYKFNTLADSPLRKGQVTAQGVFLVDRGIKPIEPPVTFAITGGTGPYSTARGTVTEDAPDRLTRLLDIEL